MSDWFGNICRQLTGQGQSTPPQSSLSENFRSAGVRWLKLTFQPFSFVIDGFWNWAKLALWYGLLLSLLAWGFGYLYVCSQVIDGSFYYCSDSEIVYLVYVLLKIFILGVFAARWIQIEQKLDFTLSWKQAINFDRAALRGGALLLGFVGLLIFPFISFELLSARIPNPDWRIEISYFAVVSIGFLVPILAMRYYAWLAFAALNQKLPGVKTVWAMTRGQLFKILVALFVLLLLMIFILGNYFISFRYLGTGSLSIFTLVSELIFNILSLLFMALWAGHCLVQKQQIFGDNKDE